MAEKGSHVDGRFDKLLVTIRAHTNNDEEVINLLKRRYEKANLSFTSSAEFVSLIEKLEKQIIEDSKNKYVHIKDFLEELKAYRIAGKKRKKDSLTTDSDTDNCGPKHSKKPRSTSPANEKAGSAVKSLNNEKKSINDACRENSFTGKKHLHSVKQFVKHTDEAASDSKSKAHDKLLLSQEISPKHRIRNQSGTGLTGNRAEVKTVKVEKEAEENEQISKSGATCSLTKSDENESELNTENEDGCRERKKGSHRQIRRLEKLLGEISEEIKKLEEKEYTLDELGDENSDCTLEDKLRKRFVKVWNKICEIKGRDTTTGRILERKFRFEGTRFPEVNKKIERFVNKLKIFPDYNDIHDIVYRVNITKHLRLGKAAVESLARDAFTAVGNQLQQRRQNDFAENFGCHLTEKYRSYDDPALYDRTLRKKLEENSNLGKSRLEDVISKFAHKQETGADSTSEEESAQDEGSGKSSAEDIIICNEIQKESETRVESSDDASDEETPNYEDSSSDPQEIFLVNSSSSSEDEISELAEANAIKMTVSSQSALDNPVKVESGTQSGSGSMNPVTGMCSESVGLRDDQSLSVDPEIHQKLSSTSLDTSVLCSERKRSRLSLKKKSSKPYVYIDRMDEEDDCIEINSDHSLDEEGGLLEAGKIDDPSTSSDLKGTLPMKRKTAYKLHISDSFKERTKKIAERQLQEQIKQVAQLTLKKPHKNTNHKRDSNTKSASNLVPKECEKLFSNSTVVSCASKKLTPRSRSGSSNTGSTLATTVSDSLVNTLLESVKKEDIDSTSVPSSSDHESATIYQSPNKTLHNVNSKHSKQLTVIANHTAKSDTTSECSEDSDIIVLDD